MSRRSLLALAMSAATLLVPPASATEPLDAVHLESLAAEVDAAERAFARALAEHRLDTFASLVAEDAVFRGNALAIGRAAVVAAWKPLFDQVDAPFSWSPDTVTVAASGTLAVSTGPVLDAHGALIGRFSTIWRRGSDGHWQAIADQGAPLLDCEPHAR